MMETVNKFSGPPLINFNKHWVGCQLGFSLIEMMVVISILAVLSSIAFPAFSDALLSTKLRSYANNFVASTHIARSEAIKRNSVVTLCVSANGTSCASGGWQQGWIVLSGTTVIQYQQATASGYKITDSGGVTSISFQPTGIGVTQATLKICRETPTAGGQERVVTLSSSGRASVTKTFTGSC